jgi:hypothetical protein
LAVPDLVAAGGGVTDPPVVDLSWCRVAALANSLFSAPCGNISCPRPRPPLWTEINCLLQEQALHVLLLHELAMISLIGVVLKKNGKL